VIFSLTMLAVNTSIAGLANGSNSFAAYLALLLLLVGTLVVTIVSQRALGRGGITRSLLVAGLVRLYEDQHLTRYYDRAIADNYDQRTASFKTVLMVLGGLAIAIPFIVLLV
jgi:hypothetical protein